MSTGPIPAVILRLLVERHASSVALMKAFRQAIEPVEPRQRETATRFLERRMRDGASVERLDLEMVKSLKAFEDAFDSWVAEESEP